MEAVLGHNCIATDRSTGGTSVYPRAVPPSSEAREDEPLERFLAVKGAVHVPVSSSCTSGKKGTGVGPWEPSQATPRNQSSNLEGSGHGGGLHSSQTLSATRASIATIYGSESGTADHPESGNGTEPSSPDWFDSPFDAAIDIRSSGGAPKDTSGYPPPWEGPACSLGSSIGSEVPVAGRALNLFGGEFLTVTVRPARLLPEVAPPWRPPGETLDLGRGTGTPPLCRSRSWSAAPRRSSPRNGSMTRPQKPPQRAQCPDTRGSDRDHHPAPGNGRIQKRTDGRASFKRRIFKKTFHLWSSFRESFALLACWSAQGRWPQ